jgi:hypothetical protein
MLHWVENGWMEFSGSTGDERTPFQMGAWVSFYRYAEFGLDMSSPATTRGFGRQAVK